MGNVLLALYQSLGETVTTRVAVAAVVMEALLLMYSVGYVFRIRAGLVGWTLLVPVTASVVTSVVSLVLTGGASRSMLLGWQVVMMVLVSVVWMVLFVLETVGMVRPLERPERQVEWLNLGQMNRRGQGNWW